MLEIDGASNRGIDEIRQLRQNVGVRPSRSRYKIYIIDEVHMLTKEAFNALLKTLEEPPEHVKFIFCTTEPTKIPITILSRCQRFDFAGIRTASIQERLSQIVAAEGRTAEPEALALLARRAAGSMRDSQSLLEQLLAFGHDRLTVSDIHTLLGTASDERLSALVHHLAERNAAGALAELDAAITDGVEVGQLLEQLLGYFRDCMTLLVGCPADALLYTSAARQDEVAAIGKTWGLETLLAVVQILEQALSRLRTSPQGRTLAEVALVRVASLENLEDIATLVAQLRTGITGEVSVAAAGAKKKAEPLTGNPVAPASVATPPRPATPSARQEVDQHLAEAEHRIEPAHAAAGPGGITPGEIWERARQTLTGMLADFASHGAVAGTGVVAISAPNRLVVTFPTKYNSSKVACERPQNFAVLRQAVMEAAGQALELELVVSTEPVTVTQKQPTVSPRQQMAQTAEHPLVRQASELFGAEVVRVDPGESSN